MARQMISAPVLSDMLCEACGYTLNGLPDSGKCPECGQNISESVGNNRVAPIWESADASMSLLMRFIQTTQKAILHPRNFYRTLTVRGPLDLARNFAQLSWLIAAAALGLTAAIHSTWYWFKIVGANMPRTLGGEPVLFAGFAIAMTLACYVTLDWTTRLAARLTHWEATYRGLRLPLNVVLRGMYYHAAHYLPVAFLALLIVGGYQLLLICDLISVATATTYLYVLSALVILCAFYLFQTYWIGMRNMMYANR